MNANCDEKRTLLRAVDAEIELGEDVVALFDLGEEGELVFGEKHPVRRSGVHPSFVGRGA